MAMEMSDFIPRKNVTTSNIHDIESINLLRRLFPVRIVDCSQLQQGGTMPNIDGYLEILNEDGIATEKIHVQVKHLTYPPVNGVAFYDIPGYLYAYANLHKGEVVLFITCDNENERFYWRYIDETAVKEFISHSKNRIQKTVRYYFKPEEEGGKENISNVIAKWRKLYQDKMSAIKDRKQLADEFVSVQKISFNNISSELHGIEESHIIRKETDLLMDWIHKDPSKDKNLCMLVGDAGVGKSVVIKDFMNALSMDDIDYICIKADAIDETNNPVHLQDVENAIALYSAGQNKMVLIIDQIDALSQSLSNDRKHLNNMMSLIGSLSDWPNVMAVVSCRKYDLEYDATLNRLKKDSDTIELGPLSNDEVTDVLNRLDDGLKLNVNPVTFEMLKTVQYLNVFCFLYQKDKHRVNFSSPIDMYDAVWNSAIDNRPQATNTKIVERILFTIAESIQKLETLNPVWTPSTEQRAAFTHLASCGIIRADRNTVSFFHQTFYDYTLARYYVTESKSFIHTLENKFQGIELRSTIKAILEYNRGHDDFAYESEMRNLLTSDKIRLHIKLLAISVLASVKDPKVIEKKNS